MLPWFILFFLLMIDLGIMTYSYVSLSNSVREGARFASVNCGDGSCSLNEVQDRVIERSGGLLQAGDDTTITVVWDGDKRGDGVTVSIDWPYDFLFFPATIDVVSCADMRLEFDDSGGVPVSGSGGC